MIKRFHIEDIAAQDLSGVVFRALDTETGRTVAVRRFFPFGMDGGGLQAEDQTAYNIAIGRLAGIRHPALRSVVFGGCDPIDGMPFIATEWHDGEPLQSLIEYGPLPEKTANTLVANALEICELLSRALAEEAVWVETELQTIVGNGRQFTFWISPLKWLGVGEESRGLESIVNLTEEIMGWKDQDMSDHAGRGLGGWLKWLRAAAATTTLHEARKMLAASVGAEPPAPAKRLATRAAPPTKPIKRSQPKTLLFVNIGMILLSAGLGGWVFMREGASKGTLRIPGFLASLVGNAKPEPAPASPDSTPPQTEIQQRAAAEEHDGVFSPDQREPLLQNEDKEVKVEGVLGGIGHSKKRTWMYLTFAGTADGSAARGKIITANAPTDLSEAALAPLVGKRIRITGKVEVSKLHKKNPRPLIQIKDRAAIESAE